MQAIEYGLPSQDATVLHDAANWKSWTRTLAPPSPLLATAEAAVRGKRQGEWRPRAPFPRSGRHGGQRGGQWPTGLAPVAVSKLRPACRLAARADAVAMVHRRCTHVPTGMLPPMPVASSEKSSTRSPRPPLGASELPHVAEHRSLNIDAFLRRGAAGGADDENGSEGRTSHESGSRHGREPSMYNCGFARLRCAGDGQLRRAKARLGIPDWEVVQR